jgi:hypothetical protein
MYAGSRGELLMKAFIGILLGLFFFLWFLPSVRIAVSEQSVSGIAYNVTNNKFISGNTHFSVRAAEDTYVSEENRSSYCLPPGSKYIALVNEAAKDKSVRIHVQTDKMFRVVAAPWVCADNVHVYRAN